MKPDFTIQFEPDSAVPLSEPNYHALVKSPGRKPLLVLMGYAYGDAYVDPDHLASERMHTIMASFTQEGLSEESIGMDIRT